MSQFSVRFFDNNDYVRAQGYYPESIGLLGSISSGYRAMVLFRQGSMNVGGNSQRDVLFGGRQSAVTKALPLHGEFQS